MTTKKEQPIVAYKAFDKNLQCRGFQYEIGKTYEHDGPVDICSSGFHACLNPLDCLNYYDVIDSRFAEVMVEGDTDTHDGDSKVCAAKITIRAELKLPYFISRAVELIFKIAKIDEKYKSTQSASGDYSKLAASGYYSKLAASGDSSQLAATGENSVIASSAYRATAKGADGTWIALAEFDEEDRCVGFATGCVGRDGIKPDVWYRADGGKLIEA